MTSEQTKEQLSIHYLGAMATSAKHRMTLPTGAPSGVDAVLVKSAEFKVGSRFRHTDSGNALDVQLKCTTTRSLRKRQTPSGGAMVFDLNVKNYNDLIFRRQQGRLDRGNPLLLMVLALPENEQDWLRWVRDARHPDGELKMGGTAWWFYPGLEESYSNNPDWKRIFIPEQNIVDLDFMLDIFNRIKRQDND